MIVLAGRVPIQLDPNQARLIAVVAVLLVIALVVTAGLESAIGGVLRLWLRLAGHRPPRRSAMRTALDEMQKRLEGRDQEPDQR